MYLSRLVLNVHEMAVLRDLSNAHKLHQRIMQAFPDEENRTRPREDWHILFRQEPDHDVVLVQSDLQPDWSRLPNRYLQSSDFKEVNLTAEQFLSHRIFQFRLRANPSKRDKQTSKIIGFYQQSDQLAWLERQGNRYGFQLLGVDVIPSPNVFGIKQQGQAPVRLVTVLYQGVLKVTDPSMFLTGIQQGVGRGKSYGCGLLSIMKFRG